MWWRSRSTFFDGAARRDRSCAGVILSTCPGLARASNHSDERPGHELEAQSRRIILHPSLAPMIR